MNTQSNTRPEAPADIIAKIEKLLRLAARGGTEAEAQTAFAKASELMTKYGIEQHQLGKDDPTKAQKVQHHGIDKQWRSERPAHLWVRQVIKDCFHVHILQYSVPGLSVRYVCVGMKDDCIFAAYAFDVLSDTFLRLQNEYLKRTGLPRIPMVYKSYFRGLAAGFTAAWKEAERKAMWDKNAGSYSIVLADKDKLITSHLAEMGVGHRKSKPSKIHYQSYAQGEREGRSISLNRPLEAGKSNQQIQ